MAGDAPGVALQALCCDVRASVAGAYRIGVLWLVHIPLPVPLLCLWTAKYTLRNASVRLDGWCAGG